MDLRRVVSQKNFLVQYISVADQLDSTEITEYNDSVTNYSAHSVMAWHKRVKKTYCISIYENNSSMVATVNGVLRFFGIKARSLRRSDRGYNIFLEFFNENAQKLFYKRTIFFVKFGDRRTYIFKKKFFTRMSKIAILFKGAIKYSFHAGHPTMRSIKKRLKKRLYARRLFIL